MDFTVNNRTIVELKSPVVCRCPYCGREVRETQRLRYPAACAESFAPVYRCGCNKIIGAPVHTTRLRNTLDSGA